MKIEKLKRFNLWKVACVLLVISVVILVVTLKTTRAKYRFTASYPAAYGTIHWKTGDLEVLAVNLEESYGSGTYETSDTVPTIGYTFNEEKSYCGLSNGDGTYTHDEDITISYVYGSGKVTVSDISKKGTKCFLYFDTAAGAVYVLSHNTLDTSRVSGSFSSAFTEDTAGRIFEGPADDYGDTTYFFAGANPNNWVTFAGFYWRIIRINGDGTVRLIYNGTGTDTTGTGTQLSSTSAFNSSYNDNAYVGYMYGSTGSYGYTATHTNTNNSTIKGVIDSWYSSNLTNYASNIDTNVGFCGDRSVNTGSGTWNSEDTKKGYLTYTTYYGPYARWIYKESVLTCPRASDIYTVSSSSFGNKKLTYPIGLITMDEVFFAGAYYSKSNSSYWLYTGQSYWTMSPHHYYNYEGYGAGETCVGSDGSQYACYVSRSYGVRPVINLKADTGFYGSGTSSDPFVVAI